MTKKITKDTAKKIIIDSITSVAHLNYDQVDENLEFNAMGLDSQTQALVFGDIEEQLMDICQITPEVMYKKNTVAKLANYIHKNS